MGKYQVLLQIYLKLLPVILTNCFDKKITPFFIRETQKSFEILSKLVQDLQLKTDRIKIAE